MYSYTYTLIYVILTALSMVFIHHAANFIPPALNLFLGTFAAIIFFHAINFKQIRTMYFKAWHAKLIWLKIMVTVSGMWLATIYAPAYLTPNLFIVLLFSLTSILGIAASCKSGPRISLLISASGIFICTLLILIDYLYSVPISFYTILGILLSLLGGYSFYIYGKQSFLFAKKTDLTVTQVLAVRFWLVEIFCVVLIPASPLSYMTLYNLSLVFVIALISLIVPIYFLMKGIFAIGPDRNAIICGLIPAVTYIIESIYLWQFNFIILILNICIGFFIGLPYFIKLIKSD